MKEIVLVAGAILVAYLICFVVQVERTGIAVAKEESRRIARTYEKELERGKLFQAKDTKSKWLVEVMYGKED